MNAFPSAREMYIENAAKRPMFKALDEYFENNKAVRKDNMFNAPLTDDLSRILCGYTIGEIRKDSGICLDFKNTVLGNMYFYLNQNEDKEFHYDVKYLINMCEDENPALTLIFTAVRKY